jgi:hypothetical protein
MAAASAAALAVMLGADHQVNGRLPSPRVSV